MDQRVEVCYALRGEGAKVRKLRVRGCVGVGV